MRLHTTLTPTLSLLFGVYLSGCAPTPPETPDYLCDKTHPCHDGLTCVEGLCGKKAPKNREIAIRVIPPNHSPYSSQYLTTASINFTTPLQLALTPNVNISGSVTIGRSTAISNAQLVFSPVDGNANNEVEAHIGSDGRFNAALFPTKYRITIYPQSTQIPPYRWGERELLANSALNLSMPPISDILTVTLSTNLPPGDTFGNRSATLLGARIYGYSTQNGYQSTTIGIIAPSPTESTNPTLSLRTFASPNDFNLRIEPDNPVSLVPTRLFTPAFRCTTSCVSLINGDSFSQTVSVNLLQDLRAARSVRIKLQLSQQLRRERIDDLLLTISKTSNNELTKIHVNPSADGIAVVTLVPGKYTITVDTPVASAIAPKEFQDVVLNDSSTATLQLSRKKDISGFIHSPDGIPLDGSRLEFRAYENKKLNPVVLSTTTLSDGSFKLWLPEGRYVLLIVPNAPNLPRKIVLFDTKTDNNKAWSIDQPTILYGRIIPISSELKSALSRRSTASLSQALTEQKKNGGVGIGNVFIELLQPIGKEHVVIGHATSDQEGYFQAILSDESFSLR